MQQSILAMLSILVFMAACDVDMHPSNQRIYVSQDKGELTWPAQPSAPVVSQPLQNSNY